MTQKLPLKFAVRGLTNCSNYVSLNNMSAERVTIEVKDLLPPKKAAAYVGVTTMTLWRWVRDGKITPVMLDHAYFHISELDRVKALRGEQNQ